MADIFDRLGSALEDVKDTFVEQAPLILPIALNILAPGMGTIAASTLGAGIGALIRGDDLDDAVRNAALAGATGAAFKGFTGGGLEGIRQDIGQTGQFFKEPFSSKQYAPSVGGSFTEQPIAQQTDNQLTETSIFKGPFQSAPSDTDILLSPQYQEELAKLTPKVDMGLIRPDDAKKAAFSTVKEEFTPSFLDKFAIPSALGLAALMDDSGGEMGDEEMPLTGAELLAMYPEEYGINLPYLDRPLFSAKNGGVARMQNGGLAGIQNNLKMARDSIRSSGQAIESALTGTSMNNFMGRATQNPPVVDTFGTTQNPRTTLVASPFFKAGHSTDQQYDEFMSNQNTPMSPFGLGNLMNSILPMEDGGEVPKKYKGFSKLPEAVQQKISPELAEKYDDGGVAQYFPRRNGGIGPGEGSGTKDDVPAMLMDGEFVMTRDAVKGIGGGNLNKGIDRMYTMMDQFERMA